MKFGLCYIPDYHPELQGTWTQHYEAMLDEIVRAEELGYDGAWFAEHRIPGFAFGNPALFMTAAAQRTSTIRLGSSVSLIGINDPLRIAEDYAMLDVLSGGRLDFGVGRGIYKYDYDMANVDMAESRDRFDEALDLIRKAWTEEEWSFEGRFKTIERHTVTPQVVQRPHPPIWIAAVRTFESYTWAGHNGFDLLTAPFFFPNFEEQRERLELYWKALDEAGHDRAAKQVFAVYHLYCGESDADVHETAAPALDRYQRFCAEADMKREAYRDPVAYKDWKGFFENRQTITFDQMRETRAIMGTPEECAERIRTLSENYGINYFAFEINFGGLSHEKAVASMERFAREVMPQFKAELAMTS